MPSKSTPLIEIEPDDPTKLDNNKISTKPRGILKPNKIKEPDNIIIKTDSYSDITNSSSGNVDEYKKSTLIYMTETDDEENNNDDAQQYKVHKVRHNSVSGESEKSYESLDTLESESALNREYSSQAASIFFGDDLETEPAIKKASDNISITSQTSA